MKTSSLLTFALGAVVANAALGAVIVSCGGGGNDSSSSTLATSSGSSSGGGKGQGGSGQGGGNLFTDGGGGAGGAGARGSIRTTPAPAASHFPSGGAPICDAKVLGPPTIAYPLDGILLPPNMNVLEVQFVPPAGATLFEVDFSNSITERQGRDAVQRGARRARRPEPGLRRDAAPGRVERHRQHEPRRRSGEGHRPRDGRRLVRERVAGQDRDRLRHRGSGGRHLLLAIGDVRRHRRQDGRHLQPRLRLARSEAHAVPHGERERHLRRLPQPLARRPADGARHRRSRRRRRVRRREDAAHGRRRPARSSAARR